MIDKNIRYFHDQKVHNFYAAEEIVPFIVDLLRPNSIVDVGCGIGTWLKVFSDNGVLDYIGIDGDYVDKNLLKIDKCFFVDYNLETYYQSNRKFDLAVSLEVAEHLKEGSSDDFIKTLTDLSDVVIFSAAVPNQGGQNHINEKEPSYWIKKFENLGFKCFDILRPVFWNNDKVDCWYKQNIFLFTNKKNFHEKLQSFKTFSNEHIIHPELLKIKEGEIRRHIHNLDVIVNGKKEKSFYLRLFINMIKSLRIFKS
jgi:hypothetical protein